MDSIKVGYIGAHTHNNFLGDKLNLFLDEYYKVNKNSGVLRVTCKDEIVYEKFIGYADIENKLEFTSKSVFTLYSLSKPFCAIGLMKLKDKNLIDIDKHPGVYLPEVRNFDKAITVRQLMNHTSGIPDFDQHTDFRKKYEGETSQHIRERLPLLTEQEMLFAPGTDGKYTNINFIICALIIENVSGKSYAEYMKAEVFKPLGMVDTCVDNKNLILKDRVKGYRKEEENIIPVERVTEWTLGGADIVSTVDDVYCLNRAIKHKLLLNSKIWDEILLPSPITSMGFGCTISEWHGKKRITHGGGWEGFRTLHIQLPEDDFDIIFLSNSAWGDARTDIADAIYKAYYGNDTLKSDVVNMDVGYI